MRALILSLDRTVAAAIRWGAILSLLVILTLLSLGVLVRAVPVFSMSGYDEIIELLMAWLTFLGAAALWREGALFRVELLELVLPQGAALWTTRLVKLVMLSLLAASLASWYLIVQRSLLLGRSERLARDFLRRFRETGDLATLYREGAERTDDDAALEQLFRAGYGEYAQLRRDPQVARETLIDGVERSLHLRGRIGDQRRQQRRGAEGQMGGGDPPDGFGRRRVVEEHIAAAVDLDIDEAGREPGALRQGMDRHGRRQVAPGQEADDGGPVDHDRAVVMQARAVEYSACC